MSRRRVIVHYPAPPDSRFATDAFEAQRGNWPPLTDGDGTPIADVVDITVPPRGAFAVITAELYPSIAERHDEHDTAIEHYSIKEEGDKE